MYAFWIYINAFNWIWGIVVSQVYVSRSVFEKLGSIDVWLVTIFKHVAALNGLSLHALKHMLPRVCRLVSALGATVNKLEDSLLR